MGIDLEHLKFDGRRAAERSAKQTRPSSIFGRERSNSFGQFLMRVRIDGPVLHVCARRIFTQEVVAFPVAARPYRARRKSAPAIRTNIREHALRAGLAEGAFETADHRVERVGKKLLVAVFAGGSEL